ncbi:MAG: parallel beta-helix domain-containing protein [Pseudomonadota bacterium]
MKYPYLAALLCPASLAVMAAPAVAETHSVSPGADVQEKLQEALILAEPGDEIVLEAGTYALTDGLSLDVDNVTVRGAGADKTILDFSGQQGSGEGLLVTSDNVVLRDFAVQDSRGDGIKSKGADNIVYYQLRVEWTGGPKETNGAYGVYPVESENVLVDSVRVTGASDAGIYVGQSRNIIVRNSHVDYNVAGIEIENSFNADVHDNLAEKNTGGILVFDLPNLPQQGGHNVRIFDNMLRDNNTPNFAPAGNIVASVPSGSAIMVMANRDVEIFDNRMEDHGTANVIIVGYQQPYDDANYQPLATNIRLADNSHGKAGYAPGFPGGDVLAGAMGGALPPIVWDGTGTGIASADPVPALTLGLSSPDQPITEAQPSLADLSGASAEMTVKPVVMPTAMEALVGQ